VGLVSESVDPVKVFLLPPTAPMHKGHVNWWNSVAENKTDVDSKICSSGFSV